MKYIVELQKKKVFNLRFVSELTGNIKTAKSLLQAYKKAGYIASIRRDLYAAVDLATKHLIPSRYEIACAISESAYISHHSALEYHGIANQVFYTVSISAKERFTTFDFDGITYERCQPKIASGVVAPSQTPLISVTDIERTLTDCLNDIDYAGGLEELLEALRLIPSVDERKLLSYLEEYDQIYLWQKAGFILTHFKDMLRISGDFFEICKSHIHDRKRYLTDADNLIYYPEWKLYAPPNMLGLLEEGATELV